MGIRAEKLVKSFGQEFKPVLKDLSFEIKDGEFVSLVGKSGSGKSTLLYLLSTLDNPTSGEVWFDSTVVNKLRPKELHQIRNKQIGFVFQFNYLLPELTALENVLMPAVKLKQNKTREKRAKELLSSIGLSKKFNSLPRQMSGGEQQRVAIARSLIMEPKYLFADEPTGSLDSANAQIVMDILKQVNQEHKTTLILVTHDSDYAAYANRQINLVDGRIV